MLRITLIARPRDAATSEGYRAAVAWLRGRGHRVRPRPTFEPGDALRLARAAARRRDDVVIAAGGDGTINEVVNGLVRERWQPRLAVLPAGTANDFAKGLSLPEDPVEAARVAVEGRPVALDVARVNGRAFMNVSTGGFGADATGAAPQAVKRKLGRAAYLLTATKRLAELTDYQGRFESESGLIYEGRFLFFAVGNARQTGGGSQLTPRAERSDGRLDLTIVTGDVGRIELLSLLPDLRAGTHLESPDARTARVGSLRIETMAPVPVNADGESLEGTRFRYGVASRPLTVMVVD